MDSEIVDRYLRSLERLSRVLLSFPADSPVRRAALAEWQQAAADLWAWWWAHHGPCATAADEDRPVG
jgi:hypothetical protein